ncbi:MAG: V-type ATP synthase subunit A [Planctomycetota bacterium]|jgi:V/A-type H+-transporting ATPase subunit A|nr:V-type ATP synthase subunit A [Planctomycetota bacterium]
MAAERSNGTIVKVSGPLVVARGLSGSRMFEMVKVGELGLLGEIIEIRGDQYSVQVYEETEGIAPGQPVVPTGVPLSAELGPGLLKSIYDGVQRPLDKLMAAYGEFIVRGAAAPALDRLKKWAFTPVAREGEEVTGGDVLGTVPETELITHRVMVPPGLSGRLESIKSGDFTVEEPVAVVVGQDGARHEIAMLQRWPVRIPRPIANKLPPQRPLLTGQRIVDMLFPVAKGGTACVPGPFGSGKTVVQHQLAKWADADIVIFIGCGERGNEMTDVLLEFPELTDPKTGRPIMERTVLVANTSNMPVAAREASVFTGITMAEYYRDMGYSVALMADSTSRWAEAMREMSGRLEEMPGDEGYPAYLASRLAAFYERAGMVIALGKEKRQSSVTIIGAVSPAGGDLSEPVTQSTLRVTKVFWGLDDQLAFQRHFPAINWLTSYSLYQDVTDPWYDANVYPGWSKLRRQTMVILKKEADLQELVRLVGMDSLNPQDRLLMETARMVREDFLNQSAFDDVDTFTSLEKQALMLDAILHFNQEATARLERGYALSSLLDLPVMEDISRAKLIPDKEIKERFEELKAKITQAIDKAAVKE